MLSWVLIEMEIGIIGVSGLEWPPVIILLLASFLSAGYAFYNSYSKSNQNNWIYLTSGLYGIGICIYRYLTLLGYVHFLYMLDTRISDFMSFSLDIGFYMTSLFSVLLFLTGFDKEDSKEQVTTQTFDQQYSPKKQQSNVKSKQMEKNGKPNLQDWLKENPKKSINDYFSKYN